MTRARVLGLVAWWLAAVMVVATVAWLAIGLAGREIGVVPGQVPAPLAHHRDVIGPVAVTRSSGRTQNPATTDRPAAAGGRGTTLRPEAPASVVPGVTAGIATPPERGAVREPGTSTRAGTGGEVDRRRSPQSRPPAPDPTRRIPTDGGRSDAGRSDGGRSDGGRADAGRSDAGRADAGRSDAGRADAGRSDAGPADAGRSDAGRGLRDPLESFADPAGQILVTCAPDRIAGWSVLPASGWTAEAQLVAPAELWVEFRRHGSQLSVVGRCRGEGAEFLRGPPSSPSEEVETPWRTGNDSTSTTVAPNMSGADST